MRRFHRILLIVLATSVGSSGLAAVLGLEPLALWLSLPAFVFSAWALLGHLVTIDDDALGGWSNPENSQEIWRSSVRELLAKLLVFVVVGSLVLWSWLAGQ
jgi:hypothetical protein